MSEVKHDTPKVPELLRVFFTFESTGFFDTTQEEKEKEILPKLNGILDEWNQNGSELLATFDRDILTAGQAGPANWHACFLYNVPNLQVVTDMTHAFRSTGLDRYFRLEASIGRPFFLLEK
ncbi:hypothetical protein HUG15_01405 [Salicibibacter cibarius]|uniref:Uncharacterized protein n=1 Tax=Salicibibacter cibarius TaxID=2743000 RepID=A0A7T6YZZ2_9BACI|nr:hypothetical protein [Salicibibacter cibarius]QQK74392.1 hypothetical protein HUG15_01405 [Salicibibacter cibarius]